MKKLIFLLGLVIPLFFFGCENSQEIDNQKDVDPYGGKKLEILDAPGVRNHTVATRGKSYWQGLAPLPNQVEGASVAVLGNKIYAAMGFSNFDSDFLQIYDIDLDAWIMGPNAPAFSSEGAGTAHGDIFYSVGGRGLAFNGLYGFNTATHTWTVLPPMPTGRAGLAVATVGNAIYAIGGRSNTGGINAGGALDVVERYDIDKQVWTTMAPLLSPRSDLAAVAHGGKIYVFGGFDVNGAVVGDVDVYNPVTDSWDPSPTDLPTPRGGLYAAGMKGGTIFVIGGYDGGFFPGATGHVVEAYKVSKDTWDTNFPTMPTARGEAGVASHGGIIYMVGGGTPAFGTPINSLEAFKP